jgi:putative hemolysin
LEPPQAAALATVILTSSALFVLASYEATYAVLSRSFLERMQENNVPRANILLRVYAPRHHLLLMTRIGLLLATVFLTLGFFHLLHPFFIGTERAALYATLAAATGTLSIQLLGALTRRLRFGEEGEAPHIPRITLAFVPLHALLSPIASLVDRLASRNDSPEDFKAEKEEEFRTIVESEGETGVLEEGEKEMIEGVVGFHDTVVREVMIPRVDIKAVELNATLDDLVQAIKDTGHSRLPIYSETLDRIRGIAYSKDLLQLLVSRPDLALSTPLENLLEESLDGSPFLHPAYYVPETKKIDELLRDLRSARTRLAVVLDEYGGTGGLVTTEDLVEEIVGEIQDEYDAEDILFHWLEDSDKLQVVPRINIEDLNELLETDLPNEDFDTLGGFIYDTLGQVPNEGQILEAHNLRIEITKVVEQRIAQALIQRLPPQNKNSANSDS